MDKSNPGDHWPGDGRYGVMCVQGYSDMAVSYDRNTRSAASHSFVFNVVDLVMCGEVVRVFKGRGGTLEEPKVVAARRRARKYAEALNARDRKHDLAHAL